VSALLAVLLEVLRKAVAQLQKALATDSRAGWAYLILGSAHAKLGGKGSSVPRR
jgi:hypothetical protein